VMMQRPELAANFGTRYDLDWHQFAGTPPGVQGLAAGTLDCATVGGLSVADGLEKGADIVLLGELIEERGDAMSTPWMATKASGIDSVDDRQGKTVATPAIGASTDYIQNDYIEQQSGLVAGEDYENVELPFAQMQETLLARRVDVGVFPQPFFAAAMATGEGTPLFRFAIADWLADPANRGAAVAASTSATGMPPDVLGGYLLGPDYVRPAHGVIDRHPLRAEWDVFHGRGALTTELHVDDHVIPELLAP
jgi:NMT1/THI5 like